MKIHEYQAKILFAEFGIPVPRGRVARTASEAGEIAAELGGKVMLKAQVHAGGRGKAGGIKSAESPDEAAKVAAGMLGRRLVTHQTAPDGAPVDAILVEEALDTQRELYLSIIIDSSQGTPMIIASEAGGMEIEELASESPEKIIRTYIDPGMLEFQPFVARRIAFGLNLEAEQIRPAAALISGLYRLFRARDCSLAEINPLVVTTDGRLLALDAKLDFDDNALYRHQDIAALRDTEQENPLEVDAKGKGIGNYVKLDGDIGIVVNGAGLAMSVMDTLKLAGGRPANFLDIGTLNDPRRVVNAFRILSADLNVKSVLVNIFGGMARIDVIATGIVEAHREMEIKFPVVVRLAGTNLAAGERILSESGLNLIRAKSFREAANKAVAAARRSYPWSVSGDGTCIPDTGEGDYS
ncbi:MAG: Succinate--CoA ligase (ADP-forming) subunit beta [Dehalococcoidia bacterium]|nr:Succinate--CoA ligase (ADP-forming) subunit beta [Chloroflexota bacterium]